MAAPDSLRYVEGELNYLVPMPERPRYYAYDAGPEAPPTNMAHEAHTVRIRDMRPISSEVALDRQGFALVEQRTAVRDFWDEDEVRRVYYPEAERFIAEAAGARCGAPRPWRAAAAGDARPCRSHRQVRPAAGARLVAGGRRGAAAR